MESPHLLNLEQIAAQQEHAKRAIMAGMDSCTVMTYSMLVATCNLKTPEAFKDAARIAIESTPYLFAAMGKIKLKEEEIETAGGKKSSVITEMETE